MTLRNCDKTCIIRFCSRWRISLLFTHPRFYFVYAWYKFFISLTSNYICVRYIYIDILETLYAWSISSSKHVWPNSSILQFTLHSVNTSTIYPIYHPTSLLNPSYFLYLETKYCFPCRPWKRIYIYTWYDLLNTDNLLSTNKFCEFPINLSPRISFDVLTM